MRLIDADALKRLAIWVTDDDGIDRGVVKLRDIDAAPPVSCAECEYSGQLDDGLFFCRNERAPVIGSIDDDFGCSAFERRQP